MSELLVRLLIASLYLWAAAEIAALGERNTSRTRLLLAASLLAGAIWWAALGFCDPNGAALEPWWTLTSRPWQIGTAVGVATMARRRREINGYH